MITIRYVNFEKYSHHPLLASFPTRRSSDLSCSRRADSRHSVSSERVAPSALRHSNSPVVSRSRRSDTRSEEHTSELQSLTNLVCRLLREKKKGDTTLNRTVYDARTGAVEQT